MSIENASEQNNKISELLAQASTAHENEQYDTAKVLYESTLKIDADNLQALLGLAKVLCHHNEFIVAKQLLDKILAINPRYAEAWVTLGTMYTVSRDLKQAEAAQAKALEFDSALT